MEIRELENVLRDTLQRLGVKIRREQIEESSGGFARLDNEPVIVYSPDMPSWKRIDLFLSALKQLDTSGIYLPPAIRDLLDDTDEDSF